MADRTGPPAIPPPDRSQIERLNSLYRIIDEVPSGGGLKARLASGVRRLLGRVLSRQQEFNATVVDHINRNMAGAAEVHHATAERIATAVERCEGVTDEVERHLEALLARERRNDTAVAALAAQQDELRAAISVVQQAAHGLKRELATLALASAHPNSQIPNPKSQADPGSPIPAQGSSSQFDDLDSHKYVGFEDQFRGSPEEIRRRVEEYLPVFGDASEVLDVGSGDGRCVDLPAPPARRIARRTVRRTGRRAPGAAVPDATARRRIREAPPRRANRARDDQPRMLVRVFRELHPRLDARETRAPG